jgi:Tol biopolymer transport system component
MTPERWRRITGVFHAALERDAGAREAFLDEACRDDRDLRAEIESMLAAHGDAGRFGETPLPGPSDEESGPSAPPMALPRGTRMGPYEVLEPAGAGGMGEVYRARDLRLDRMVALKVLPSHLAEDVDRQKRFEQEARIISQLNHPHICAIYDVGRQDGVDFIVMEFVEGETLARRMQRARLALSEALLLFAQVADALAAAHRKGVVHRDLKPANVQITPGDKVKVLDFGIAKAIAGPGTARESGETTVTRDDSQSGIIIGTPAYMSPEQARGKPVDRRTDIWSFGCCLYEALAGKPAFGGDTASDTMVAVLEREPDWEALPPQTPPLLESLLRRCLQKDAERRQHDMADVRIEIEECLAAPRQSRPAVRPSTRRPAWRRALPWALGSALLLLAGFVGRQLLRRETAVPRLSNPTQVSASTGLEDYPTWSPDGRMLAYESNETGNWDIWVSQVGGGRSVNRTEDHRGDDRYPSWSPDGRQIAFWSDREGSGYFVVPALGGHVRKLGATAGHAAFHSPPVWSADSSELAFASLQTVGTRFEAFLEVVSLATSESTRTRLPGAQENRLDLSWSPDHRFLAYVDAAQQPAETTQILVLGPDGATVPITDARSNVRSPRWSPDGSFLYFVSNRVGAADVWRQRIASSGGPGGEPQQVTAGLEVRHVMFSPDGSRLAYSKGRWVANVWRVPIRIDHPATWSDAEQMTFDQAYIEFVDVSPDGRRLAFSSDRTGNQDLWTMPVGGGEMVQLTADPAPEWAPRWSHDGTRISFYSHRSGDREMWVMPAMGGPARQLTRAKGLDAGGSWSPDDREIAFRSERNGSSDLWVVPAEGGDGHVVAANPAGDYSPSWSPDGQWLAFGSNRAGKQQIWRVAAKGGEPELLTRGLGVSALWSRDGTRVFFVANEGRASNLWAVSLADRREYAVTNLAGRRGSLGNMPPSTDGKYLYFTWRDDPGDIWAMDIVQGD